MSESTTEDLGRYWNETTSFINEAKREGCAVLVYDFSGVSRSPTFVMAYLIMEDRLLFREALFAVKQGRHWANPIMSFCKMLSDLEFATLGVRSVLVVYEDREKAHLEFPEDVELPQVQEESDKKDKKKKKKKNKKEKKQGSLRLKVHEEKKEEEGLPKTQPKR